MIGRLTYEQRAVAAFAALAVITLTTAGLLLAAFVATLAGQRTALAGLERTIERRSTDAAVSSPDAVRDGLARRLFPAATPAELQSAFQSLVKDAAVRNAIVVDAMQILKTERAGGLARISMRLEGIATQTAYPSFIADLAAGAPTVVLDTMEIRPAPQLANRLNNGGVPEQAVSLRMELSGYGASSSTADRGRGPAR